MFFVNFAGFHFKSEVSIPGKGIEFVRSWVRKCERKRARKCKNAPLQRAFFAIGFLPEREPIRPRGDPAITSQIKEEDKLSFRVAHVSSRQGRLGTRGAKKPRYKNVHRGGALCRKHGKRGQIFDLPQDE